MAMDRTRPGNLSTGLKADGTTSINKRGRSQELSYSTIKVTREEAEHARGVVAASSKGAEDARNLLEHLGLMPDQEGWYIHDGDT